MSKFGSKDISQIVDRLLGRAEWIGESNADADSLENLAEVEYLLDHLFKQLVSNVESMQQHPENYSAKKLGNESKDILLQLKSEIVTLGL